MTTYLIFFGDTLCKNVSTQGTGNKHEYSKLDTYFAVKMSCLKYFDTRLAPFGPLTLASLHSLNGGTFYI